MLLELYQYQFRPDIGVKRLNFFILVIPYYSPPIFMPTYTPTKGSYFYQLLLGGLMDTNSAPKDEVQQKQKILNA